MALLTADKARTLSMPYKFGSLPFFTPDRVKSLRNILGELDNGGLANTGNASIDYEWNTRVMSHSYNYLPLGPIDPWDISGSYDDPENSDTQAAIYEGDANTAVEMAIRWLTLNDARAGAVTVRILEAWSTLSTFVVQSASGLVWSNHWPVYLQAAMMVRNHPAYTVNLELALRDVTERGKVLSQAYTNDENRGAWGVCHDIAVSVFLADRAGFDRAIQRWRSVVDGALVNNVPIHEVYREGSISNGNGKTGLWYSNFLVYALTAAAEWARFSGEWLYDYVTPDGSSFKGLYENVRTWSNHPETFIYNTSGTPQGYPGRRLMHDDVLYALWPSQDGAEILARYPNGSSRDTFGMRQHVLVYRNRPLIG